MKISQYPTGFRGCGHYSRENIMVLACYVTLQDHGIKMPCDFMGRSPSK